MSAGRRVSADRAVWLVLILFAGVALALAPAPAAIAGTGDIVKYYLVTAAYQGKPESLSEIGVRFLGTTEGAADIFALNENRVQSDGGALTTPDVLHPGWALVLPWDAVGDGVVLGVLPGPPAVPASVTTPPRSTASPGVPRPPTSPDGRTTAAPATPIPSSDPDRSSVASPGPAVAGCVAPTAGTREQSLWAQQRLDADRAWTATRGDGQVVAVVDSGVRASASALVGRVAAGVNIVSGTGQGDVDCLGSGTAMAGVIAARGDDRGAIGVAPGATILPIVVRSGSEQPLAERVATGIEVAASAGATIIAVGSAVDLGDPAITRAVQAAASLNVVVVVGAPLRSAAAGPRSTPPAAAATVLRVAGIDRDGRLAADYEPGAVDVVAPGLDVASLGLGDDVDAGDGTHYAVGFVAGEAALVRAAFAHLNAAEVIARIKATTESTTSPAAYGWGLINPAAAVMANVDGERAPAETTGTGEFNAVQIVVVVCIVAVGIAAAVVMGPRVRRMTRLPEAGRPAKRSERSDG